MDVHLTKEEAQRLTQTVNDIDNMLRRLPSTSKWKPIINSIKKGHRTATVNLFNPEDFDFIDELKANDFKVDIVETRFSTDAIIKW